MRIPDPILTLSLSSVNNFGMLLQWTYAVNNEATAFKIERKTSTSGYSLITAVKNNSSGYQYYTDTTAQMGVAYTYKVTCTNKCGASTSVEESIGGLIPCVTPTAPSLNYVEAQGCSVVLDFFSFDVTNSPSAYFNIEVDEGAGWTLIYSGRNNTYTHQILNPYQLPISFRANVANCDPVVTGPYTTISFTKSACTVTGSALCPLQIVYSVFDNYHGLKIVINPDNINYLPLISKFIIQAVNDCVPTIRNIDVTVPETLSFDAMLGPYIPFIDSVTTDEVRPIYNIQVVDRNNSSTSCTANNYICIESSSSSCSSCCNTYEVVLSGFSLTLGDMNGDGVVNNQDISPFVLALTDPVAYAAAYPNINYNIVGDINEDGMFNNQDMAALVNLLTTGSTTYTLDGTYVFYKSVYNNCIYNSTGNNSLYIHNNRWMMFLEKDGLFVSFQSKGLATQCPPENSNDWEVKTVFSNIGDMTITCNETIPYNSSSSSSIALCFFEKQISGKYSPLPNNTPINIITGFYYKFTYQPFQIPDIFIIYDSNNNELFNSGCSSVPNRHTSPPLVEYVFINTSPITVSVISGGKRVDDQGSLSSVCNDTSTSTGWWWKIECDPTYNPNSSSSSSYSCLNVFTTAVPSVDPLSDPDNPHNIEIISWDDPSTWSNPPSGVTHFQLWRSTNQTEWTQRGGDIPSTTFTSTDETEYATGKLYYKLRYYFENGNTYRDSCVFEVEMPDKLSIPINNINIAVINNGTGVTITIIPPNDGTATANWQNVQYDAFQIFYRNIASQSNTWLAGPEITVNNASSYSANITDLYPGYSILPVTYEFAIRTLNYENTTGTNQQAVGPSSILTVDLLGCDPQSELLIEAACLPYISF
mgnify:CR=1 FL=1